MAPPPHSPPTALVSTTTTTAVGRSGVTADYTCTIVVGDQTSTPLAPITMTPAPIPSPARRSTRLRPADPGHDVDGDVPPALPRPGRLSRRRHHLVGPGLKMGATTIPVKDLALTGPPGPGTVTARPHRRGQRTASSPPPPRAPTTSAAPKSFTLIPSAAVRPSATITCTTATPAPLASVDAGEAGLEDRPRRSTRPRSTRARPQRQRPRSPATTAPPPARSRSSRRAT